MATGMYPGIGKQLYLADGTNIFEPVWLSMRTPDPVIPDDDYSIPFPFNPGLQTDINVSFDSAPTTDAFDILYSVLGDFSDEYILDSVAATTDVSYTWTTNSQLSGMGRLQNKGTADINVAYVQSRAATNT